MRERERRWNLCPWYSLLLWVYAVRPIAWSDFRLGRALDGATSRWQDYFKILPSDRTQRPAIEQLLLPAFAAADHAAVYYSYVYRSSYVFNFLFAALAVTLALVGIFVHEPEVKTVLVSVELVVIIAIVVTWLRGQRGQWHRRWLDYRRLAECLRHIRVFAPLGAEGSIDRPRRSLDADETDWVAWYAWSLRRLVPLPDRAIDSKYLEALRDAVRFAEIEGQIAYHKANAVRMTELNHRIHRSGGYLFAITGALCVAFLGLTWVGAFNSMSMDTRTIVLGALTFLTALLPTLGGALGGIQAQGDFKTVAEQSARTQQRLSVIDKLLESEQPTFARLTDRIEKTSDVMMSDLLEWQTVFRTRPLAPPA